ncbi:MAG TPA: DUF6079 family protein [Actinomycetota bacterium]|nr:DUF6079 family protein [Actinomycetota bacterium]
MSLTGAKTPGLQRPDREPTIADLVEVTAVETVVRLDGRPGRLSELVLTGDVVAALSAVLGAARPGRGEAFFLVGHFGSGKSHLLAALAELVGDPSQELPAGWDRPLREAAGALGPALAVAIPLVEHRAGAVLEDLVLSKAWEALGRPVGQQPPGGTDRRAAWDTLLSAAAGTGRGTLVVALDELSEFLRAKQGPALIEDLRFLQFLGEWATGRPVVVVAALQESIEEVANVSQRELTRIRDRYRTLALSMRHVEDLVRGRLLRLRPGAEASIEQAHRRLQANFPGWDVPLERFARCYPVHPDTLALLEGLRFLFSQQRGVVDFICRQMRGDVAGGIPWQERGYLDLLTPDRVFDHFRARLQERSETRRLAEAVVPYWERAVEEVFQAPQDRALALRAAKLLCLLAASPLEAPRTAGELAHMLLARLSTLDAEANVAYFEQAVLQPLAARGAYVVARPGPPLIYAVELAANAAEAALARMGQARAELAPGDRRVVRSLIDAGSSPALPLQLLSEIGASRREFLWQNTLRRLLVAFVRVPELSVDDAAELIAQARSIGAEGALLVGEPELEDDQLAERARAIAESTERLAVWAPNAMGSEDVEAALELHTRRLVLDQATREGHTEAGGVVELLGRSVAGDAARARELLRRSYFGGVLALRTGPAPIDLPSLAGLPFDRLLANLAEPLRSAIHPLHREVAPRAELVGDRLLRQLIVDVIPQRRVGVAAAERGQLRPLIAGYLVPLGLVRRRGDAWVLAPDPARSPAVSESLRLVAGPEGAPAPEVVRALAEGPVGLTEPEALIVLNACVQTGLLEAVRGRRPLTDPFLAVSATDRLSAGELVEPSVRAALAELGPALGLGDLEPWSTSVQRAAWDRARAWLRARKEDLAEVRRGVEALADSPALGDVATGNLAEDVAAVAAAIEGCDPELPPVPGLSRLAGLAGAAQTLLASTRRLGAVARFFREAMAGVEQSLAYLSHPDLELPAGEIALAALRDDAQHLASGVLALAAEDRVGELVSVLREFRRRYLATYREAHDGFYAASAAGAVETFRAGPPYRALAALAKVGAVAVPDDLVKVDRALGAAVPAPCNRRLDVELSWKPRCACGFALGQQAASPDFDAILAITERGVLEHLAELGADEPRLRLEAAVDHLAALGRDELAADLRQLLAFVASPVAVDWLALAHLLDGPLTPVVRDVLGGAHLVVRRDLSALREELTGRRYPKRRLLELFAAWVDPAGDLPAGGYVEVVDSQGAQGGPNGGPTLPGAVMRNAAGEAAAGATAQFLSERFPRLAALVPAERPAESFWLAAWWTGGGAGERSGPPAWLPTALLAEGPALAVAAHAAGREPGPLAELMLLDAKVGPQSLLGDQMAAALRLADATGPQVAAILASERLFRHPMRLSADELARRLRADWQLALRVGELAPGRLAEAHPLVSEGELAPLGHLLAAAAHLAEVERRLAGTTCRELVEEVYPAHFAPVSELLSRAELASVGGALVSVEAIDAVSAAARRLLGMAEAAFRDHQRAGFAGTLRIWEVGRIVLQRLLATHGRVAVLMVDAMRADLWNRLHDDVASALAGRTLRQKWAVVPEPTRTTEAVAALYLGRPVPPGAGPASPADLGLPFAHLGYESAALVGVDRPYAAEALRELWATGPKISVAVATSVDEMLHRSSVELAGLLDEAVAGLQRRVLPTLAALPAAVPLVVLADHGFRESASWGQASRARWTHGGLSLEECVVPVAVFGPAEL